MLSTLPPEFCRAMTEDEFKARFLHHFAPIRGFFEDAMSTYLSEYSPAARADHDPSIQAQCLHGHIVKAASKYAAGFSDRDVAFANCNNLEHMILDGHVEVRFKKLGRDLQPRNNETRQSLSFRNGESLNGFPISMSLDAGYTLNAVGDAIESVHLIRWASHKVKHWIIDIVAEPPKSVVHAMFDLPEATHDEPSEIRPRKSDVVGIRSERENDE